MIKTTVKFKELFRFLPKSKLKASEGKEIGLYKFFTSSPIQKKWIDNSFFKNESLIFGTGGFASVHYVNEPFSTSTDCLVAQPLGKTDISTKFIYQYLHANLNILERGFKGAGLRHISKTYIEEIDLPLPPLLQQEKISKIIDKSLMTQLNCESAILKLKKLGEAIFFDMFVNSSADKTKWSEVTVEYCASSESGSIRTGPFGSDLLHSEFTSEGIAVLGIDNAVENKFNWSKLRFISDEKYLQLKKYTVKPKDVLITIMGTCGRCAIVPDDIGLAINTKHLCCITLDQNKCLPEFIHSYFLMHPTARKYLIQTAKGAIMNGLNMNLIRNMPVILPPLDIQKQYATLIKQLSLQLKQQDVRYLKCQELHLSIQDQAFRTGFNA